MGVLCRWILVSTLLLAAGPRVLAASAADRAFDAARKALDDTFYARAEAQFADFSQKFPASPRLPEAILLQAEARIKLTNYAGAIALLSANQAKAGTNADEYLFWLGEAYAGKGDWRSASATFASLVKEYPASTRCLAASIKEAQALSALARTEPAEWQRVIGLLEQTNGVFQSAARTNAANEWVPPGYLLLSEAQLATKDYRGAEATLQPLAKHLLSPKLTWQWQYLLCRIQLAGGQTNAALATTTNLLATAASASQTNLLAESAALQAGLFESLGRTNDAIGAYKRNLADGVPDERQRQALLKVAELYLAQGAIPEAALTLEQFLARYPKAASVDLAWLTLGELRLRLYEAGVGTNAAPPATTNAPATPNNLQLAAAAFSTLVKEYPHSPFLGKAQLDLGWCYRQEGRLPESQAAFQAAVERLPFSKDLAIAYFRLAGVQLQQTNFAGAIKSYQTIIQKFGTLPEVKTNLFGRALYQTVRAGVAGGYLADATNALQEVLAMYPASLDTARAVLLTGQAISRRGQPAEARKMFLDFIARVPDTPLLADLRLAVAVTYEQESQWSEAIAQYDNWLASFPTNADRARAEYYRALDTSLLPGQDTNALTCFTNLMARFPTNEFAPLARLWVADYYYRTGDPLQAELNYKLLSQDTNWPVTNRYEAQLMAGRAAVAHQGWGAAKSYFTNLYNNLACPTNVRVQALFEYGQTLMAHSDPTETNQLANCEEATRVFGRICDEYPSDPMAAQAWAAKAECYTQWALATQQYDSLTNALNAYQHVVASPHADVAARSKAKVGLAIVLQKWAEHKTGKEQTALLEQALSNCVDVVYGNILRDDERLDRFGTLVAAEKGMDLAEALQAWSQEASIYKRLTNSVWPLPDPALQRKAAKAFEHLKQENGSR